MWLHRGGVGGCTELVIGGLGWVAALERVAAEAGLHWDRGCWGLQWWLYRGVAGCSFARGLRLLAAGWTGHRGEAAAAVGACC
ncbi:hypothetical protein Acr_21g0011990 [Actinidia rufa]|uniref:Uncharacterized protein n=1 Tax=Actinidia rufa TaxID=165716 RepID=A0A7J0GIF6_9ERIC|nr:hypothetical protein Acr_21g0011990 [Actinidia rufa]